MRLIKRRRICFFSLTKKISHLHANDARKKIPAKETIFARKIEAPLLWVTLPSISSLFVAFVFLPVISQPPGITVPSSVHKGSQPLQEQQFLPTGKKRTPGPKDEERFSLWESSQDVGGLWQGQLPLRRPGRRCQPSGASLRDVRRSRKGGGAGERERVLVGGRWTRGGKAGAGSEPPPRPPHRACRGVTAGPCPSRQRRAPPRSSSVREAAWLGERAPRRSA